MRRSLLINILLVITGILLALALFGAGAVWKGRIKPTRPSVSAPGAVGLELPSVAGCFSVYLPTSALRLRRLQCPKRPQPKRRQLSSC